MILIGSYPMINIHGISLGRKPHDIDVVCSKEELAVFYENELKESKSHDGKFHSFIDDETFEIDTTENLSNKLLIEMSKDMKKHTLNGVEYFVPEISTLIAIKESHIRFPVNFMKNIKDWIVLHKLKELYPYTEDDKKLLELRYNEAKQRNLDKIKRINLNKPNDAFFNPAQELREFEHDDLHRIVAFYDKPIFEMVKDDMSKAAISREMFENLPVEKQLRMIIEECMVIGYERFGEQSKRYMTVYQMGFAFFSTNLCKGWFQDFLFDNFDKLYKLFGDNDYDFVDKINQEKTKLIKLKGS